jgi:hypothetical protein
MQVITQSLDELTQSLSPLDVDWMDTTAENVIAMLTAIPQKTTYAREDIGELLDKDFEGGILACRLFLGLSKDNIEAALKKQLEPGGSGVTRFKKEREAFLDALVDLGLIERMEVMVNHQPVWSDILVERLRSGRGSAVSGIKRGRGLEDFAEELVKEVFGEGNYELRCNFTGKPGKQAKCDIAIPNKAAPRIVIESKAYGATGSKMTDIHGDVEAIIDNKRHDTAFLFVTDGLSWEARLSDLRKIVDRQIAGEITRIYTMQMRQEFLDDLKTLKQEMGL